MSEVITVQDLETLKKHEIFEAEVITGKVGGLATGANISNATNAVTGQTQDTLPKILSDLGMQVQSWPASVGGTLTSPSQMFLNDIAASSGRGDYYAWTGSFPKVVAAGTDPAIPGSGYVKRSDKYVKVAAREALRRSYAEAGYTLVAGSFEAGGTLTSVSDVLLHEASGKGYSSAGPFPQAVSAGTNPASPGFTDRSGEVAFIRLESFLNVAASISDAFALAAAYCVDRKIPLNLGAREYETNKPIALISGLTIITQGAKFIGKPGVEGADPYAPVGIVEARNVSGVNILGKWSTYIDHNEFSALGTASNKPTITGFLGVNCTGCDFGGFSGVGSVNYFYSPSFVEYGVFDLRNSTDCIASPSADGLFEVEPAPASTPSTIGIFGRGNTRCFLINPAAKNTYWSGIQWEGTRCKVLNPVVRRTKGSNLNLSGFCTSAYNVDLEDSRQGNISIGEGTPAYSCNVVGGVVGKADYANVSLNPNTDSCEVDVFGYGWGQLDFGADPTFTQSSARVRGKNNIVKLKARKVAGGLTARGPACAVMSTTLSPPDTTGNIIDVTSDGANVIVRAPNTRAIVDVSNYAAGAAVDAGFRCAGSRFQRVRAENCNRPLIYAPNTADSADFAGVSIGEIIPVNCPSPVFAPMLVNSHSAPSTENVTSTNTSVVLDETLYRRDIYTNDASLAASALAGSIRFKSVSAFGDAYGWDIVASTASAGTLIEGAMRVRYGSVELVNAGATATAYIAKSANGTRYKLEPPNGGGAATWVAA